MADQVLVDAMGRLVILAGTECSEIAEKLQTAANGSIRGLPSPPGDIQQSQIAERLNSAEILPATAFRRNHALYELVGYVNGLLGCRLARNTDGQGVFKDRITRYLDSHDPKPDEMPYYQLVRSYLHEPA